MTYIPSSAIVSEFDLDSDNANPDGITAYDDKLWVLDSTNSKVYAYNADGTRSADDDFDLDADNVSAFGITAFNGKFWIADGSDSKVYAYNADGTRSADDDFDLDIFFITATGITYYDNRFWVVDNIFNKVYAYNAADGTRSADDDFDLDTANDVPNGITAYDDKFWIPDNNADKVYAYNAADGTRSADDDFDLDTANDVPNGITAYDDKFWIPDNNADKVYAYNAADGTPVVTINSLSFDLHADNSAAAGITFGDDKFWVIDGGNEKIYSYTIDGTLITSFDLVGTHAFPGGIVFHDNKLWSLSIVGTPDIIVYNLDGSQDGVSSYELNSDNVSPQGLAYGNNRFWTVDATADKIFAYDNDMALDSTLSFDLHADNTNPSGVVFAFHRLWVLSVSPKKVFVYFAADGTRDTASEFNLGDNLLGLPQPSGITIANSALYVTATIGTPARVFAYVQDGNFFRDIADASLRFVSSFSHTTKRPFQFFTSALELSTPSGVFRGVMISRSITSALSFSRIFNGSKTITKRLTDTLSLATSIIRSNNITRAITDTLSFVASINLTRNYTRHIFYEKNHISNERQFSKDTTINDTDNFLGLESIDTGTGIILITNAVDNAGGALSFDYNPTQSPNLANESTHTLNVGVIRANAIYRNGATTKLLIHNNTDDHFYDYDYDIATKTTSNEADLGLFAHTVRGMAIQNQKLIIVDTSANPSVLYDYDYDPGLPAATRLSNQRLITGVALLNNVRVMAANDGGIYTARNNSSVINHYEYDEENGTISNNTEIINSANNSPIRPTGLAIVRNKLIWLDRNRVFYDYDLSGTVSIFGSVREAISKSKGFTSALDISSAGISRGVTVSRSITSALNFSKIFNGSKTQTKLLFDTLTITTSLTRSSIHTRAINAVLSISRTLHKTKHVDFTLDDNLSIGALITKSGTHTRHISATVIFSTTTTRMNVVSRQIISTAINFLTSIFHLKDVYTPLQNIGTSQLVINTNTDIITLPVLSREKIILRRSSV